MPPVRECLFGFRKTVVVKAKEWCVHCPIAATTLIESAIYGLTFRYGRAYNLVGSLVGDEVRFVC